MTIFEENLKLGRINIINNKMKSIVKVISLAVILCISTNIISAQEGASILDNIAVNNEIISKENISRIDVKYGDTVKIGGNGNPESLLGVTFNNKFYPKTIDGNGNWFVMISILDLGNGDYNVDTKYTDEKKVDNLTTFVVSNSSISNEKDSNGGDKNSFLGSPLFYILLALSIPLLVYIGWYFSNKRKK